MKLCIVIVKGIFHSSDMGKTWESVNNGLTSMEVWSLGANSNGDLYAGTWLGGVFRSTDNGKNWKPVNLGLKSSRIIIFNIFSLANDPNCDILTGTGRGRIFRTSDEGETWVGVDNNFSGYNGEVFDVRSLTINSKGHYFAGMSNGVFHSKDKGANWDRIGDWSWPLATNSFDYLLTTAPLKTVKGSNEKWIQIKSNSHISSLAVDSKDYLYIGTEGNGVLRSRRSTTKLFQ